MDDEPAVMLRGSAVGFNCAAARADARRSALHHTDYFRLPQAEERHVPLVALGDIE
jgi:hypothetical protein